MDISKEAFYRWKHDPITMAVMAKFKWFRDFKLAEALSPDVIRAPDSQLIQREYLGCIDTLDLVLNLSVEELFIPTVGEENVDIL